MMFTCLKPNMSVEVEFNLQPALQTAAEDTERHEHFQSVGSEETPLSCIMGNEGFSVFGI